MSASKPLENLSAPIQRLPHALLSNILESVARPDGRLEHARVCKLWLAVARHVQHHLVFRAHRHLDPRHMRSYIASFPRLRSLVLAENSFWVLSDSALASIAATCPHLIALRIETCDRFNYRAGFTEAGLSSLLDNCTRLEDLHLVCPDSLTAIPPSIHRLTALTNLHLTAHSISPDTFTRLQALKSFSLFGSTIKDLPADFGNMRSLESLEFHALAALPHSMGHLPRLTRLHFGSNCYTPDRCFLPPSLTALSSLVDLLLWDAVTAVPLLNHLTGLQTLFLNFLGDDPFPDLPAVVGWQQRLQSLTVNTFEDGVELSQPLASSSSLTHLSFSNVPLLPRDFFLGMSNLRTLELCNPWPNDDEIEDDESEDDEIEDDESEDDEIEDDESEDDEIEDDEIEDDEIEDDEVEDDESEDDESEDDESEDDESEDDEIEDDEIEDDEVEDDEIEDDEVEDDEIEDLRCLQSLSAASALENLTISGLDDLTRLPHDFGQLSNLRQLDIQECRFLHQLPDSLTRMSSLESLSIGYCHRLTGLPKGMGRSLCSLRKLHLKLTALTHLPASFSALSSLEDLEMETTNCPLPEGFGRLPQLKSLRLLGCEQRALPASISALLALTSLSVVWCPRIQQLPGDIGELPALEELDLSSLKRLKSLPRSLLRVPKLRMLVVACCPRVTCLFGDEVEGIAGIDLGEDANPSMVPRSSTGSSRGSSSSSRGSSSSGSSSSSSSSRGVHSSVPEVCLPSLQTLKLIDLNITSLCSFLPRLSALQKLHLEKLPSLRSLSGSLLGLRHLRELRLRDGGMEVRELIGGMSQLTLLELADLKAMERLPESLASLCELQELILKRLPITSLPDDIGRLTSLLSLELERMPNLRLLPDSLMHLLRLERLDVCSCPQLALLPSALSRMPSLFMCRILSDDFNYRQYRAIVGEAGKEFELGRRAVGSGVDVVMGAF